MSREKDTRASDTARIAALEEEVANLRAEVESLRKLHAARSGTQEANFLPFLRGLIANPLFVLAGSLGAALAFAALIILDRELSQASDRHAFYLIYMVPIAVPFVAFLLDRAQRWLFSPKAGWQAYLPLAVDLPVVVLGFARALYSVPFISGHALFLVYALLTVRSRAAGILSALILAEVIYFKVLVWHDPTLYGGALVATAAALLFHLLNRRNLSPKLTLSIPRNRD